jgi:hypothetical protein
MPLFLKSIDPTLDIFGNEQSLRFNADQLNNEANLILQNLFTPLVGTNLNTGLAFVNSSLNGFRFKHEFSTSSSVFGNFYLECASRFGGNSSNIFKYDELTDSLSFFKNVSIPALKVSGNLDLQSNKIVNLANGTNNNDAVNLGQLNSSISGAGLNLSTNGFVVRTATNTYASRSLTSGNGINITNPNGFSGNPTIALNNSFNTSANVTVNWWNSDISTDILDYVVSSSITYPIFINSVKSGSSGSNNLRYWQTISGLGDNTGANAYWSLSYYNQALGVNKVYLSIGIPQNTIYLNAKVDLLTNDLTTSGNINATTGTLKGNNLAAYNSGSIVVANALSMNSNYITGLANPVNNQDAATKQYVDNSLPTAQSLMHGYLYNTQSTNIATGDHIKFDNTAFTRGSNISLDTSTAYNTSTNTASIGRITLAAGKTYRLIGISCTASFSSTSAYLGLKWHNNTTNTPLGTVNTWWGSSFNYTSGGAVVAYITTTVTTRVELRINNISNLTQLYGTSDSNSATWFVIEEV